VGATHLLTLGSNRYDFWRVALDEFAAHPVAGTGARSFRADYLVHGRSYETPARAHSLVLDVAAELGVVGLVLLLPGLGIPLWLAGRNARLRRAPGIAGLGAGSGLVAHACVDWIWTFPAVVLPGLVALGVGAAGVELRAIGRRTAGVAAAVLVLVAAAGFAPPWLAARFTSIALQTHVQQDLDRARRFDPLSTAPLLAEAQLRPLPDAIPALRKAVSIEPRAVADRYLLGIAYLYVGRRDAAATQLRAALRLKPGDPQIVRALRQAGG
jgi:tetratricopeptide (TPR) repeat protein